MATVAPNSVVRQGVPARRDDWHSLPPDQALKALSSAVDGLDAAQALDRQRAFGPNELAQRDRSPVWRLLLAQFKNVMLLTLLAAMALSVAMGKTGEAVAIGVIVLFAAGLSFAQEFKAERAIASLRALSAPLATVIREGDWRRLPAREVVPGDILVLAAGDRIPADARLIEAANLRVDESALTGESVPVEKQLASLDAAAALAERTNMVHAATTAVFGRGLAVVTAIGSATQVGQIAGLIAHVREPATPLQRDLDRVGKQLLRGSLAVVAVVVLFGLQRGQPLADMVIFGIALAVAVVPEALPAVVTVSLALGVQRLARRNAVLRRLAAAETLGSTTVICTDKTGTLTRNEMTVRGLWLAGQDWQVGGAGYSAQGGFAMQDLALPPSALVRELATAAVLASDAHFEAGQPATASSLRGDPTEGALLVLAHKAEVDVSALRSAAPRLREQPFTSESKRMACVHQTQDGVRTFVKGAPEVVVSQCTHWATDQGPAVPFEPLDLDRALAAARRMADGALRVMAIAWAHGDVLEAGGPALTLLGLVGMDDPPRAEAAESVARCQTAGVRVVMITGDHPATAAAVARELGILKDGRLVTGAELQALTDAELAEQVNRIAVFARVAPADKLRIVQALQARGEVVAMTGDGINDAPALKRADIGVAMGRAGTDVAKDAAAMTLTDDNFATVVAAVEEGRAIYDNIKKYLMYLLSSNTGELGLMVGATLLGWPLPLSAIQLLYVNLATDGLPALALALDPPAGDIMRRRPRPVGQGIFTPTVVKLMLLGGLWSTAVNLALYHAVLTRSGDHTAAATVTFLSLVGIQFLKAYTFRSQSHSTLHKPFRNRWLNWAVAGELLALAALYALPSLRQALDMALVPASDLLLALGVAITVVPVLDAAKWWLGRSGRSPDKRLPARTNLARSPQ